MKRPEDWTSQELEDAGAVIHEFANLKDSKTGKTINVVVDKKRLPELQAIGKRARQSAQQTRKRLGL